MGLATTSSAAGPRRAAWQLAAATIAAGEHQLVVLDEITYPMNWGWIDTDAVVHAIRERPEHVNVVATGRDAPAALIEVADTVTEMVKVRHAYDRGMRARAGSTSDGALGAARRRAQRQVDARRSARGAAYDGPVCFIATATAGDDEMAARIARHRAERPPHWQTVEEPLELEAALARAQEDALVIVDCLTLWVEQPARRRRERAGRSPSTPRARPQRAAEREAPVIAVSNEVGMGIVPTIRSCAASATSTVA